MTSQTQFGSPRTGLSGQTSFPHSWGAACLVSCDNAINKMRKGGLHESKIRWTDWLKY